MHKHESPAQTEGRLIRWASIYDGLVNFVTLGHARILRSITLDHTQLEAGEKILDVGCGTGGVTIPAKQRVGSEGLTAGIDPSPEMIAVAKRKAVRAGLEIDFRVGVIESLPYEEGTFDVVTSSLMMHHLPGHIQVKGLAEVMRVLKPGGRLLIADMTHSGTSLHERAFAALTMHRNHATQYGIEDLPNILEQAGFEKIKLFDDRFLTIGFLRASKPLIS